MGFGRWLKTALGIGIGIGFLVIPGAGFFASAAWYTKLGISFGLTALNLLVNQLLGPKAPDTPNLEQSLTVSASPAQFIIGRMRVPGQITRVFKTASPRHYTGEESLYILYTVAHHSCTEFHGMWFNNERFIKVNDEPKRIHKPGGGLEDGGRHGPVNLEMLPREGLSDKGYRKLRDRYAAKVEVYYNFSGDNSRNEAIPGLDGVIPNSALPVSWVCLRLRDERTFWSKPEVRFNAQSATFEITGTDNNAAIAIKNFMMQTMGVEEGMFNAASLAEAQELCQREGRTANGVWRHNEKERIYRSLLEALDGSVTYRNGELHVRPDKLEQETFTITQDMCTVPVEHKPKGDLLDYANTVMAEINDADSAWKQANTGEIRNDPAITEDGRQFVNNIGTLRLITNIKRAREYLTKQLARIAQYSELQLVIFPGQYEIEETEEIASPGEYVFELTVKDQDGNISKDQVTINI